MFRCCVLAGLLVITGVLSAILVQVKQNEAQASDDDRPPKRRPPPHGQKESPPYSDLGIEPFEDEEPWKVQGGSNTLNTTDTSDNNFGG